MAFPDPTPSEIDLDTLSTLIDRVYIHDTAPKRKHAVVLQLVGCGHSISFVFGPCGILEMVEDNIATPDSRCFMVTERISRFADVAILLELLGLDRWKMAEDSGSDECRSWAYTSILELTDVGVLQLNHGESLKSDMTEFLQGKDPTRSGRETYVGRDRRNQAWFDFHMWRREVIQKASEVDQDAEARETDVINRMENRIRASSVYDIVAIKGSKSKPKKKLAKLSYVDVREIKEWQVVVLDTHQDHFRKLIKKGMAMYDIWDALAPLNVRDEFFQNFTEVKKGRCPEAIQAWRMAAGQNGECADVPVSTTQSAFRIWREMDRDIEASRDRWHDKCFAIRSLPS